MPVVLIIESDCNALAQMRRVLGGMDASVMAASDEDSLRDATGYLSRKGTPPELIVARVSLPSGSGIRLLEEAAALFPKARHLLVSHYPKSLLYSLPHFTGHAPFLQEEFTDEEFRNAVERLLARVRRAGYRLTQGPQVRYCTG